MVDAFADAILALDDSLPTGTYVDMCANLPVVDPPASPCRRSSQKNHRLALHILASFFTRPEPVYRAAAGYPPLLEVENLQLPMGP